MTSTELWFQQELRSCKSIERFDKSRSKHTTSIHSVGFISDKCLQHELCTSPNGHANQVSANVSEILSLNPPFLCKTILQIQYAKRSKMKYQPPPKKSEEQVTPPPPPKPGFPTKSPTLESSFLEIGSSAARHPRPPNALECTGHALHSNALGALDARNTYVRAA
ncbi:hypothetical protein NE237_000809 [Protea cynaroides]|uniref:Uncharacterized protein n=1 Tax=Protea cynaroides TaxID=273540 RepID=A0A9Q0QXJ1_9MAGN|nr:hypothetical protein NE237_000809 [Protea cynaroides]